MNTPIRHYVILDGQTAGPYTIGQMRHMWREGRIHAETQHFMDGYAEWLPLHVFAADLDDPAPAALPPSNYSQRLHDDRMVAKLAKQMAKKSRGVYILLGLFFLGLFGGHNFYAGRYGSAIAQLLITVLLGWLILPLILVALWVIFELIFVTEDAEGNPFS
jgi:TM2 domain-containing membrane protein YozV